jgi:localization factor PodJL
MTSGVSWNETGMSPELREVANEAARRSGLTVDEWMKAAIAGSAARSGVSPQPVGGTSPADQGDRLADRLERIAHRGSHGAAAPAPDMRQTAPKASHGLADAVAKLNERLDQMTVRVGARASERPSSIDHALGALRPDRTLPAASPEASLGLDRAVAEIAARQRALDEAPAPMAAEPMPAVSAPPTAPDFSGLERHLQHITTQIETLRHPCGAEQAIAGLRLELNGIARAIENALPGHALAALQSEVRALSERLDRDHGRQADSSALVAIERGLADVRAALNAMTPAENLAGFDHVVHELSRKIDLVADATPDPASLRNLEMAIAELRRLAGSVASADALATLAEDVHALAARIDQVAVSAERVQVQSGDLGSLGELEQHIVRLADKIEATEQRAGDFGAVERAITELMQHVTEARSEAVTAAERVARAVAAESAGPGSAVELDALKRDLATLQSNQSQADRRTQDTLEAVHDTLERLVDRLAMVETDLRTEPNAAPAVTVAPLPPATPETKPTVPVQRQRPAIDPDLPADMPLEPGTASSRARSATPAERIAASQAVGTAPRDAAAEPSGKANFIAAARRAAQAAASEAVAPAAPRADERLKTETPTSAIGRFMADRRRTLMIGIGVFVLVVGTYQLMGLIGASNHAPEPPRPTPTQSRTTTPAAPAPAKTAAVVEAPAPAAEPAAALPPATPPNTNPAAAFPPIAATPTATTPPAPTSRDITGSVTRLPNPAAPAAPTAQTITQVAAAPAAPAAAPEPPLALQAAASDKLPPGIGGPALRTAALAGNSAAEYEVGVRFAEGRGTPINPELAAHWFERAGNNGLAPALYRLGSLYEKGQGVKKDLERARKLYMAAADKGNAKAIHNLAVLHAEGIDGKPDYRAAAQWFRRAAERGVADSQYNLGILYARGIGVDQNLAESYKWFALAAAQGDQDAGKKRDDVGARLDQQSLVAARLAVQTFTADPPPEEAMTVKTPPGGWDRTQPAAAPAAPARAKPATVRRRTGTT